MLRKILWAISAAALAASLGSAPARSDSAGGAATAWHDFLAQATQAAASNFTSILGAKRAGESGFDTYDVRLSVDPRVFENCSVWQNPFFATWTLNCDLTNSVQSDRSNVIASIADTIPAGFVRAAAGDSGNEHWKSPNGVTVSLGAHTTGNNKDALYVGIVGIAQSR